MHSSSISILLALSSLSVQAQQNSYSKFSYTSAWKLYDKYVSEGRLKSSLAVADSILQRAKENHDFSQMAKSWLCHTSQRQQLSPDSLTNDLQRFETLYASLSKPTERAIFHLLIASVYHEATQSYSYSSDEEKQNYFQQKAVEHLDSISNILPQLIHTDIAPYSSLLDKGIDSHLFKNDVLSLVISYIQDNEWIDEKFRLHATNQAIHIYTQAGMHDATLWYKMKRLSILHGSTVRTLHLSDESYADSLKLLLTDNTSSEVAADVFITYMQTAGNTLTYSQRVDLIRQAIHQWPDSPLLPNMKAMEQEWLKPSLCIQASSDSCMAGQPQQFKISHRQLGPKGTVTITITSLIQDSNGKFRTGKRLSTQNILFTSHEEVEEWKDSLIYLTLPAGRFRITARSLGKETSTDISCSTIKVIFSELTSDKRRVTVLDALTGLPVPNCRIDGWWSEKKWRNHHISYRTDENGTKLVDPRITFIKAYQNSQDSIENACTLYGRRQPLSTDSNTKTLKQSVFTDRAVYRPGQTVHASAIIYEQSGDEAHAKSHTEATFTLRDTNGQLIQSTQVKTDSFGTATTDFVLPKNSLNGRFTLSCGTSRRVILIEEYKRPTFEVVFDTLRSSYALGDTVRIMGYARTFTGQPIRNAIVRYTISTNRGPWLRWNRVINSTTQTADTCATDDNGQFSFSAILDDGQINTPGSSKRINASDILNLVASAEVTNAAGETQSNRTTLHASNNEFALSIDMPTTVDTDSCTSIPCSVMAQTTNGSLTQTQGTWYIRMWNTRLQQYTDTLATGTFTSSKPIIIPKEVLHIGSYTFEAVATDKRGNEIVSTHPFTLWSHTELTQAYAHKQPLSSSPYSLKDDLFIASKQTCQMGDTIDFWLAASQPNPYVLFTVASQNNILIDGSDTLCNGILHHRIVFDERCADGLQATYVYVRNGQVHQDRLYIQKVIPKRQLTLKWKTFRNHLVPGQDETWTLSITDANGRPVSARFMATLYDASLDALGTFSWPFKVGSSRQTPMLSTSVSSSWMSTYMCLPFRSANIKSYVRQFNTLRPYDYYLGANRFESAVIPRLRGKSGRLLMKSVSNESVQFATSARMATTNDTAEKESLDIRPTDIVSTTQSASIPLRRNFTETAFFYPSLSTNASGDVNIHFTLPDCITRWQLEGLAHTSDMHYGRISSTIVANKNFTIQPHMPRFVRSGDKANIPAVITNTSNSAVHGTVTLRLINPQDENIILKSEHPFTVGANASATVMFDIQVPTDVSMLVCETSVRDKHFSDGERNWLPVLTSRKRLIESHPFYLDGCERTTIQCNELFNKLSPTATERKAWIEYTDQPAWQAFLALHTLPQPQDENALSWSASLYAHAATSTLVRRIPHFENLIKQWSNTPDNASPLRSELNQNPELKEFLTQETPWVTEAHDEESQKQSLSELLNTNQQACKIEEALGKLSTLQNKDGGWSWYPGMQTSLFTTLNICELLARMQQYIRPKTLQEKSANSHLQSATLDMLHRGITYLTKEEIKKYHSDYEKDHQIMPSESSLRFLYILAFTDRLNSQTGETAQLCNDYLDRISQHLNATGLYHRAMMATILQTVGRRESAQRFATSLHEQLVSRPSMGTYFDSDESRASWNDQRLSTHIATMQAFDATLWQHNNVDNRRERLNMMLWLLRQKQGQRWDNVLGTLDACHYLLQSSPDTLLSLGKAPIVRTSSTDTPVRLTQVTPGLGYIQSPLDVHTLTNPTSTLSIESQTEGVHWGSIMTECMEETSFIQQSQGDLNIGCKWYLYDENPSVNQNTRGKESSKQSNWMEITDKTKLHAGQKIRQRLIIQSNRDLNFVQVKSQRAACLEPTTQHSGYIWVKNTGYYQAVHDASMDLFFDTLQKGTTTIDTDFYVTRKGTYQVGVSTIQCAYNSSLVGHTKGLTMKVEE